MFGIRASRRSVGSIFSRPRSPRSRSRKQADQAACGRIRFAGNRWARYKIARPSDISLSFECEAARLSEDKLARRTSQRSSYEDSKLALSSCRYLVTRIPERNSQSFRGARCIVESVREFPRVAILPRLNSRKNSRMRNSSSDSAKLDHAEHFVNTIRQRDAASRTWPSRRVPSAARRHTPNDVTTDTRADASRLGRSRESERSKRIRRGYSATATNTDTTSSVVT